MDDEIRGVPAETGVRPEPSLRMEPAVEAEPWRAAGIEPAVEPEGAAGPGATGSSVTGPGATSGAASDAGAGVAPIPPLGRSILIYTLIRLGLIVVLTTVLFLAGRPFGMPLIVALAFAIVLQLPLSVVLFRGARNDLTAGLARAKERRTTERDRLFTELTGEQRDD